MARPLVVLILLSALLASPGAALAQDPFSPLPPPRQATPEPTPQPTPAGQEDVSREVLLGIAGGVLLIFLAIGWYITRDARRNLTEDDRRAVDRRRQGVRPEEQRHRSEVARKQARAKARAQRQARKAQRRR